MTSRRDAEAGGKCSGRVIAAFWAASRVPPCVRKENDVVYGARERVAAGAYPDTVHADLYETVEGDVEAMVSVVL